MRAPMGGQGWFTLVQQEICTELSFSLHGKCQGSAGVPLTCRPSKMPSWNVCAGSVNVSLSKRSAKLQGSPSTLLWHLLCLLYPHSLGDSVNHPLQIFRKNFRGSARVVELPAIESQGLEKSIWHCRRVWISVGLYRQRRANCRRHWKLGWAGASALGSLQGRATMRMRQ